MKTGQGKTSFQIIVCLLFLLCGAIPALAEAPANENWKDLPVQALVARLDRSLSYPDGVYSGKFTIIDGKGNPTMYDFQMHVSGAKRFLEFTSPAYGVALRVLALRQGEDIWAWDARRRDLLQLRGADQFDAIMRSGLSFRDLSGALLEANFHPADRAKKMEIEGGKEAINYSLIPMLPSSYGRISVLQNPAKFRPFRLDIYDRNTILFKTIEITYDVPVLHLGKKKDIVPSWPVRFESLDLQSGSITRMEIFTFDDTLEISEAIFLPDYLNR
ncbi:MAG: outer membrane lipoprotein-sorting protein [Leptospiraceae bacterium]|nr:outer membrane lipoprotein-sorting protein [Leptospiraceae bacterium]